MKMLVEAGGWVATGVGAPLVAVILCWAILVLHCDRERWRPLDPLLVALLGESAIHQIAACIITVSALVRPDSELWCSGLAWLLPAVRTMQAGTLTSLALGRFLRYRPLLLYHIACLAVLSSCVGVAAVLARNDSCEPATDRRFVIFWLGLHGVLFLASVLSLFSSCCKSDGDDSFLKGHQRRQLLNSSSDLSSALSDISMISTMRSRSNRGISHSASSCSARTRHCLVEELLRITPTSGTSPPVTFLNGAPDSTKLHYSSSFLSRDDTDYGMSEPCYVSSTTSASSTNSRVPCLTRRFQVQISLATVLSVLTLCYVVNHVPVLVLSVMVNFFPHLVPKSWPLDNIPLWTSLIEGILLPVILAVSDKMFQKRVAAIYTRRRSSDINKPLQGLHGKFRPFNNTLLDASHRPNETSVRFPITNGSLFTRSDGRVPHYIHHYKRCKGFRTNVMMPYNLNTNLAQRYPHIANTPDSAYQLHANMISAETNKVDNNLAQFVHPNDNRIAGQCLTQRLSTADLRQETELFPQNVQDLRDTLYLDNRDSEDDYDDDLTEEPLYATLSGRSACSATTAANDDFDYFQDDDEIKCNHDAVSSPRIISRCSSADGVTQTKENVISKRKSTSSETLEIKSSLSKQFYRQQPPTVRRPRSGPLNRRLGLPPTPPAPKRLTPVLSVDCLIAALRQSDVSFLDTGDLCRHYERVGSEPDLKKVFYTGFL